MKKHGIAILGCGWLGFPLAKKLVAEGFMVHGSVRSEEKLKRLSSAAVRPFQIQLTEEKPLGKIASFLSNVKILIIAVPPGLHKTPKESFFLKIKTLLPLIEKSPVENLLFISSISVFEATENFSEINENTNLTGTSKTAEQLIAIENLLFKNRHFTSTILRLGGLFDDHRHPVNHLAGRKGVENPKAPVNLIHRDDVLEIIGKIIENASWGNSLNAVYPEHPSKKNYYVKIAQIRGLEIPLFDENSISKGKTVLSEKLQKELGFRFLHPI